MTVHHQHSKFIDRGIVYPDSDGKPMADNTLQAFWIVMLYNNLKGLFAGKNAFVAADLFWYPIQGDPNTKVAPDVLVAIGRPDGHRGSYKQWMEENIPPQIVFEILSPSNTPTEMLAKRAFYEQHKVTEFVIIDPDKEQFQAFELRKGELVQIDEDQKRWQSSALGIVIEEKGGKVLVSHADGSPFKTFEELEAQNEELEAEKDAALQEIELLKQRLRELGDTID